MPDEIASATCAHIASIKILFLSIQNVIKDVHTAVVDNDMALLTARTSTPVPGALAAAKDANGLTPLHKASGLNYLPLVEYLLGVWPEAAKELDGTGKTPLHWAASPEIFNRLVRAGADEQAFDYVICFSHSFYILATNMLMNFSLVCDCRK